ncbi:DUF3303 domain-containing protein [Candidatus Bipolaricaulota bacterium]
MLFVATLKGIQGTGKERMERRLKWQYPEGVKPIAEYWLQGDDPTVIGVFEADSVAPIFLIRAVWGDVFDVTVVPAVTAEEGLQLAQKLGGS